MLYNDVGLISQGAEDVASKSHENRRFRLPHWCLTPLSREPLRISAQTLCRQKLDSMAYIFAADSMGLSSFNFLWWAPKDASLQEQNAYRPLKVIQGR